MSDAAMPIHGRIAFHDALRAAFAEAASAGCAQIWLCDPDFADWPLGERSVIESLSAWVASQRRLTLIAGDFDPIVRRHPRWVAWRRAWAHVVDCRSNPEIEPNALPTIMVASGLLSLRLVERVHHRGLLERGPRAAQIGFDTIDAVLQRSVDAFPATTAGL